MSTHRFEPVKWPCFSWRRPPGRANGIEVRRWRRRYEHDIFAQIPDITSRKVRVRSAAVDSNCGSPDILLHCVRALADRHKREQIGEVRTVAPRDLRPQIMLESPECTQSERQIASRRMVQPAKRSPPQHVRRIKNNNGVYSVRTVENC
jgi:hypothetical protein